MMMVVEPDGDALDSGAPAKLPLVRDRTSVPRTVPLMTRTTDELADTGQPESSLGDRGAFALLCPREVICDAAIDALEAAINEARADRIVLALNAFDRLLHHAARREMHLRDGWFAQALANAIDPPDSA